MFGFTGFSPPSSFSFLGSLEPLGHVSPLRVTRLKNRRARVGPPKAVKTIGDAYLAGHRGRNQGSADQIKGACQGPVVR